jgi:hypothetical protein
MEEGRIPDKITSTRPGGPLSIKKDCANPSSLVSSLTNKFSISEAEKTENATQISKLQEIGATEDWEQYDLPCFGPKDVLWSLRMTPDLLMALDVMDGIRSGWFKTCIALDQKLEICLAIYKRGVTVKKPPLELETSGASAKPLKDELDVEGRDSEGGARTQRCARCVLRFRGST